MSTHTETISHLKELADILRRKNVIANSGPIDNLVRQLEMWKEGGKHPLKYRLRGLEFPVYEPQFIRGDAWEPRLSLKLDVDVTVSGDSFVYQDISDLTVNIHYDASSVTGELCKGAWHLDFHNTPEPTRFMHPIYHFHHGGKKLDDLKSYGNVILLDAPRVMHHPLDIFLAIDFVISNFIAASKWHELRADTRYKKIIEIAQKNWWKPYYEELGNYWDSLGNHKGSIAKGNIKASRLLNPHLI
ncbi:hypothetical protein [Vibrio alginolyticus]|uniref:hypothetical protein n=1 Tax=Vibrio alginolyticus TaxID=663 RepID=UPI002FEF36E1